MIRKILSRLTIYLRALLMVGRTINEAKMLTAKLLVDAMRQRGVIADIKETEFKVFSQFGEDGIIQYLVHRAQITPEERVLVEFGSDFYGEANTRFLVMQDYWRALLMDGSEKSIATIRKQPYFWERDISTVASFITAENVNDLIGNAGFRGKIGLLSIDIDGVDYWVWDKIDVVNPVIVVAEFNSVFGPSRGVTVPYDPSFYRLDKHYSGLYWGCSLKALELLGARKGYALVGCNKAGNNCFFVKRDRLNGQPALTSEQAYVESPYRESRDRKGNLTYVAGRARLEIIADMPLIDIASGATIQVRDLIQTEGAGS
ncbi:MAG: hypothetical protein BGN85_06745 [Alphaproteobacteria bacterium 64-11]|nr:MAG: hypothetical protein BGN85_06745 [Alphaproteobacteria bacterium 64-11]